MTEIKVTGDYGVFRVEFVEQQIEFLVDRIKDNSSMETHSEVTITGIKNGGRTHINRDRLNMTSRASKNTLIKHLNTRFEGAYVPDWTDLVEAMCSHVLDRHREGIPSVNLKDTVDEGDEQYMMQPLVINEETTLIFGDGGTAKSYLALAMAMSLATGREFIPGFPPLTITNPMILDWETSRLQTFRRFRKLAKGQDMRLDEIPDLEYRKCVGKLEDEKYAIKKTMLEKDIGLLIVDSVSWAAGGDLNEQTMVQATLTPLRWLNATSFCIGHVNKENSQGKAYGSVFWHHGPRATFEIIREKESDGNSLNVGIFQRKANDDEFAKPVGLALVFSEDKSSCKWARIDIQDVPDLAKGTPIGSQIKALLRHKSPLTSIAIAQEIDAKESTVRQALNRGKGKDFIIVGAYTPPNPPKWGLYAEEDLYR